jgi:hypothetical protein
MSQGGFDRFGSKGQGDGEVASPTLSSRQSKVLRFCPSDTGWQQGSLVNVQISSKTSVNQKKYIPLHF